MKIKTAPTHRLNHCLNAPPSANLLLRRAVDQAIKRFQIVPLKSNIAPRKRKANGFELASDATNWGRKARKKSATLGFKTLVRKPWTKMPCTEAGRMEAGPGEVPAALWRTR